MKLNLLIGLTLLVTGSFIPRVEAETINSNNCNGANNCPTLLKQHEISKSANLSTMQATISVDAKAIKKLPLGKISRVVALNDVPHGNAKMLKNSANFTAQIAPTDSDGNRIFRATRSGSSYFGVGANFGLTGGSNLGGTSFAIISKLGLTDTISVRPGILILRDFATILIPVTYDFAPQQLFNDVQFAPYVGVGVAINTGLNSNVGPMITGGIDIPISSRFTINVAANLAFLRTTDLGILVGFGYNF
ncbi:hypothetical protein Syn7502_00057 [Synechococcus sp. PCC 7502]|uniref:hypothetical protein n=1 Tax=Synechococcus sp. PCC 7502 TaxID=1173263 RepID=UPI00029F8689|nr:hypothetical protein [Synechococcus sp. PCC 7502]AFY72232.1 hypothetical protein Syn7502_00057 [Synechococcus sp. PCC 7502]